MCSSAPTTTSNGPISVTTPTSEDTQNPSALPVDEPLQQGSFLTSAIRELKLVVWPSRQQLLSESIAVILMVGLSAAAITVVSRFFSWVASQVFR